MTEAQREEITKTCTISSDSYDTVGNGRVYRYTVKGNFDVLAEETEVFQKTKKYTATIGRVTISKLQGELATIELAPEPVAEVVTPESSEEKYPNLVDNMWAAKNSKIIINEGIDNENPFN